jgi:hypothetical protein
MLLLPVLCYLVFLIVLVHYDCACTFNQLCNKLLNQLRFFRIAARSASATAFFSSLLNLLNATQIIWAIL